ncbi:MAG TPA: NAD(P)H-dependent oxidoreductase subunit E [Planctomycetota bacterium]|nr:NAD(P)H-dependent oxidoreductase subunit E [Planctomycetota bacterium]
MDLKIVGPEPTTDERACVDAVLGAPTPGFLGGHEARSHRDLLLPALRAAQDRFGWIPPGAFNYICERLLVPPAEAYGVATFYHLLSVTPKAPAVAHVCDDVACRVQGGEALCAELERRLGPEGRKDASVTWRRSPCLGLCERAPAALVLAAGERPAEVELAPASAAEIERRLAKPHEPRLATPITRSVPQAGAPSLRLLARAGRVAPDSLAAWRASGGGKALAKALEIGPAAVVREVTASGLMGRGGAAFPTGRKWEAVSKAPELPHFAVCNADESEPGTFKDRVLMEEDPFGVLEGLAIAAFATGCKKAYIYIRGEYPLAAERIGHAIAALRGQYGFALEVELRRGAGAYICGEETALFNSIEGKRGEPRNKPPYPVQSGLFEKPTVINNVETLVNVPLIVLEGGAAFAGTGTSGSKGPKLFCVSGHVTKPGVYEVPFGTTLRGLLELAGGVRGGRAIKAVLLGGAAGSFVGPDKLDTPLTFEGTRAIGASLGSGVVMVFDETTDLGDTLSRIARFFRDESCGQCVPCRVGTQRQEELLVRLRGGRPLGSVESERALLRELGQAMRDASICGLGHTATTAIESALASFDPFAGGAS